MTHETGTLAPDEVRRMFDRIAPVYDAMNRVMTAGLDRRWRKLAVKEVVWPDDRVLDACCGTGDLAVEAERRGGRVVGLDFSERMLERARKKSGAIEWVQGDAMALPFGDGEFDAVTVGFGVRNLEDLGRGLAELARVLRPDGRIAVLEITRPRGLLRPFFRLWFDVLVPLAGKVLPGGKAYTYLPASVRRFPGPEDLSALMAAAGFRDIRYRMLGGGSVALHTARAPTPSGSEPQSSGGARLESVSGSEPQALSDDPDGAGSGNERGISSAGDTASGSEPQSPSSTGATVVRGSEPQGLGGVLA